MSWLVSECMYVYTCRLCAMPTTKAPSSLVPVPVLTEQTAFLTLTRSRCCIALNCKIDLFLAWWCLLIVAENQVFAAWLSCAPYSRQRRSHTPPGITTSHLSCTLGFSDRSVITRVTAQLGNVHVQTASTK